jgi:hypothetical protein
LLWLAVNQDAGINELPAGWVHGRFMEVAILECGDAIGEVAASVESFFWGCPNQFVLWLGAKFAGRTNQFERTVIKTELETVSEFGSRLETKGKSGRQLALL